MKVALYYTRPFETGGIEKTMYARGKYLSENGYDVTFIYASYDSPIDMLEKWATVGNVKHLDICKDEKLAHRIEIALIKHSDWIIKCLGKKEEGKTEITDS